MIKDLRKISLYLLVPVAALLLFVLFYYLPLERHVSSLRAELNAMQTKIFLVESLMENDKPVSERVRIFRERVESLRAKFPGQEKDALKKISQTAPQFYLSITSIQSQPPADALDELSQPLASDGKKCRSVVVAIEMKGNFRNFVKFVDRLKNDLPYFTVRRLSLVRDSQFPGQLMINFEMNVYLLL